MPTTEANPPLTATRCPLCDAALDPKNPNECPKCDWVADQRGRFHLVPLPKYSPDLNAEERIWHHVRMSATHNRYHASKPEFVSALGGTLRDIALNPQQIAGYLVPFL